MKDFNSITTWAELSKNSNFTAYSPPPSPGLGHDHDDMDSHAISGISAITDIDTKRMSVRSQASWQVWKCEGSVI